MFEGKWNVLVVVDESEECEKAVDCAIDLNVTGLDTKLYLLYVADVEPLPVPSEKEEKKWYSNLRSKADKTVLCMTEKLKKSGMDYEVVGHHYGIAAEKIEKTERENEIDMIIIGVQKPSILRKILGGHYSDKAIYETRAPVLVVKPAYVPKVKTLIESGVIKPAKVISRERESATT